MYRIVSAYLSDCGSGSVINSFLSWKNFIIFPNAQFPERPIGPLSHRKQILGNWSATLEAVVKRAAAVFASMPFLSGVRHAHVCGRQPKLRLFWRRTSTARV